ncbi:PREDICTED: uncharacterized protein LOC108358967 isoform X2 [Rhagoletis zephyria]|uniref:uncharacterized protein LOC108358967 isoform X2 n=1 Tax=Rhagoletis zephyria TaxID=28612 RepID=UPI0008112C53|nr:PREDICTED: uncharacterized protein LOC108358967 isoform X2 [Rhagoletis zephyria]
MQKDHHQTEPRLKETLDSKKKSIFSSRNKKSLSLLTNKRKSIGCLISKKKLKRVATTNKNKCISKAKTIQTTLKHPKSYPIIKQIVSSEKVRCVVESLRDDKITKGSTTETSECYFANSLMHDKNKMENVKMEQEMEDLREQTEMQQLEIPSNDLIYLHRQDMEDSDAKTEQYVTDSDVEKIDSQIQYSSINRVDNFVIMVDANAGHVEIKYAGPLSSPNEIGTLQNPTEMEIYIPAHDKTQEEANKEYEELGYMKASNSTTNMKSNASCYANISTSCSGGDHLKNTNICVDDVSKNKIKQSNQGDIIDLSLKETTVEKHPVQAVHRPSSAELIYRSSMWRGDTNQGVLNTQPTVYGPERHLLPAQQTSLPCHQQLLDQSIFNKVSSSSTSQPNSCNHSSTEIPKRNANHHQKHQTAVNKLQPASFHRHSFSRRSAHLETPPISPIDCQWRVPPPKCNFPIYDQQKGFRKGGILKLNEFFSNSQTNTMPSQLACGTYKNSHYPIDQLFTKQLPKSLREARQANAFDRGASSFHHRFDQIQPTPQNAQQHQVCCDRQQYPEQINYPSQMSSQLDLQRQFYNPLHQSFLSDPYYRLSLKIPPSNGVFEPKETRRFSCRPNTFPNVRFQPLHNYLPPTPPITDRCFPSDQSTPTTLPFPSPNWTNTLYKNSTFSPKSQPYWNVPPHLYSIQSRLPSETEYISRLHTSALSANPINALTGRGHNSTCFPTPMHMQSQQQFPLNYF